MEDETREALKQVRQQVDDLTSRVTLLVRALEQDDHLSERADRAAEQERDARHADILGLLREQTDALALLQKSITRPTIEQLRNLGWAAEGNGLAVIPQAAPVAIDEENRDDDSISFKRGRVSFPQRWIFKYGAWLVSAGLAAAHAVRLLLHK